MRLRLLVVALVLINIAAWYYIFNSKNKLEYKNGVVLSVNSSFFAMLDEDDEPLVYIQGILVYNESAHGSGPYLSLVQDEDWAERKVAGYETTRLYIDIDATGILPDCIGNRVIILARYRLPRYLPELGDVQSIQSISELSPRSHNCFDRQR